MIRHLTAFLACLIFSLPVLAKDSLSDIEAIDNVVGKIDEAFEANDPEPIKALMTDDHIAVLPYRPGPETKEDVLKLLPEIKFKQTDLSEPTVVMLGPDSAMRTVTAKFKGTYAGKEISERVFVTSILVKTDGKWFERFYQVTTLAPTP